MISRGLKKHRRKIGPLRILGRDEGVFLCAGPSLELFLTRDRVVRTFVGLVIDQAVQAVTFSEAFDFTLLMFPNAADQAVGYTDVQDAAASVGHIDEERFHGSREILRRASPAPG